MPISALQKARYSYAPKLPAILREKVDSIALEFGKPTESISDSEEMRKIFPLTYGKPIASFTKGRNEKILRKLKVGVILSGGQAPGGHNVIAGIFDGLKAGNRNSLLLGFKGGPSGLIEGKYIEITEGMMNEYRNTGGFDMIGSGRTKIETHEQFEASLATARKLELDGIIVIGGDDSNTNAALLAEFFQERKAPVSVIGVPKTIDGDLKNEYIETSFGFDTATKTYSELIGNIERDANSAKKYWHFIKLMGRAASHIALECALQCRPSICLISEEVEAKRQTLAMIVEQIVAVILKRAEKGENFGVVLVPEGLVEFIPEMKILIAELNDLLSQKKDYFESLKTFEDQEDFIAKHLSKDSAFVFNTLPDLIQRQLLMDRDPHGNVQVSRIETEKLLIEMTEARLGELKSEGKFKGKFSSLSHFFGYEGRCAFPSNFDADYCYSLGFTAFVLIASGLTGYISSVRNLAEDADHWIAGGIPLTMMMNMEKRHGAKKPVIKKALVELSGAPFKAFAAAREGWAAKTSFAFPGAIQYYGPPEVCDQPTMTLKHERGRIS